MSCNTCEILLKIDRPNGQLSMNFGIARSGCLQIVSYQFSGLINLNPLFFELTNIPNTQVIAGTTNAALLPSKASAYPLLIDSFPNNSTHLEIPITLMAGDNLFPDARDWHFAVTDLFNNPAVFSNLVIRMVFIPVSRYHPILDGPEIKQAEVIETSQRNRLLDNKNRDHNPGAPNRSPWWG